MRIPAFEQFYPTERSMRPAQRRYYAELEQLFRAGEFPDVKGNISYVFVYLYKLLEARKQIGLERLYELLIGFSEAYKVEPILYELCREWAYDCLLVLRRYEEFLEKSEPEHPYGCIGSPSNARLNVQQHLGRPASAVDIVKLFSTKASKFVKRNPGLYRENLDIVFDRVATNEAPWFHVLTTMMEMPVPDYRKLFDRAIGASDATSMEFAFKPFYTAKGLEAKVQALMQEAENAARTLLGVPKIGEGWVSESMLYRQIAKHYRRTTVIQHGRPEWLGRQHFDIWLPDWRIAVEFHGEQHFEPVDHFGGEEAFRRNQQRDRRKLRLSRRHGVKLLVVTKEDSVDELIDQIDAFLAGRAMVI